MAEFPEYRRRALVQQIGVIRTSAGAGEGLAQAAAAGRRLVGELAADAERESVADATTQGREAGFQRDENGNLVFKPLDNSTAANRAYNQAGLEGYRSSFDLDTREAAARIRRETGDDSAAFAARWQGHTEGALAQIDPGLKVHAEQALKRNGVETANAILTAERTRDVALSNQNWQARVESIERDMASLAGAGQTGSERYVELTRNYEEALQSGVSSRFIGDEAARLRREATADEGEALALSRVALEAYEKSGRGTVGVQAAERQLKTILDDPNLAIPEARRLRIVNVTQQRIREAETLRRQEAADVRAQAEDAQTRLELGYPVPRGEVDALARRAEAAGDAAFAGRLRGLATLQEDVAAFARLPVADQRARIDELDRALQAGGGSALGAQRAVAYQRAFNAKRQALSTDAFAYGAKAHRDLVGPLAPIDWSSPDIAAGLRARVAQAEKIAGYEGVAVLPLDRDEIGRLAGTIAAGNATQRTALAASLADGLGPRHLPRVMAAIIEKSDEARLFATASGIAQRDPALARRIFLGFDVMQSNKNAVPEDTAGTRSVIDNYLGDVFARRPDARGASVQAAMALYAAAAGEKGDFSKTLDSSRMEAALSQITGGVIAWRGGKIVPPRPGMSRSDFAKLMDGLTDEDLGPLTLDAETAETAGAPRGRARLPAEMMPRAADGRPVTAQMIKDGGRLWSIGDGRYLVTIRGWDVIGADGRAFELDLRNKDR